MHCFSCQKGLPIFEIFFIRRVNDIKSLADSVRALAVQLSTFTWLDKTIKSMGGSVSTLVDQQKASQSRMGDIEKVISQPSGK